MRVYLVFCQCIVKCTHHLIFFCFPSLELVSRVFPVFFVVPSVPGFPSSFPWVCHRLHCVCLTLTQLWRLTTALSFSFFFSLLSSSVQIERGCLTVRKTAWMGQSAHRPRLEGNARFPTVRIELRARRVSTASPVGLLARAGPHHRHGRLRVARLSQSL